jgi:hypothetical protein
MSETVTLGTPHRAAPRPIGAHSRRIALGQIDGRRREARLMREIRDELIQHCSGGKPSAVQRRLCERAAALALRLALMDEKADALSERDGRQYLAWHSAYVRTLKAIGMKPVAERVPTLAEHLAAAAAARAQAAADTRNDTQHPGAEGAASKAHDGAAGQVETPQPQPQPTGD